MDRWLLILLVNLLNDTVIFFDHKSINTIQCTLEYDFHLLSKWLLENEHIINYKKRKTEVMIFHAFVTGVMASLNQTSSWCQLHRRSPLGMFISSTFRICHLNTFHSAFEIPSHDRFADFNSTFCTTSCLFCNNNFLSCLSFLSILTILPIVYPFTSIFSLQSMSSFILYFFSYHLDL